MSAGRGRLAAAAPLLLVGLLAALRFHEALLGGVLAFRDAGYFFLPLRHLAASLLRAGELPLWNDLASCGRALAANPNGAVFWPLTPLLVVLSPTALALLHVALALGLLYVSLRWARLAPWAAAAGTAVLLLAGPFQTLPILATTLASAAPLPLAAVALGGLDPADSRGARRRVAVAALSIGLSFLGGEPVITAIGAAGAGLLVVARSVADGRRKAWDDGRRRLAWGLLAVLLAAGIASVQLLPAFGELSRSARGRGLRPEEGALFWSVSPARLLTYLEPRLTGDPFAEADDAYWGAGTFDARNPYFYDLSVGLLPLALAAAGSVRRRGRLALLVAGVATLLSLGRHLPGYAALGALTSFARYPEKWSLLATYALAFATAVGADAVFSSSASAGVRAARGRLVAASLVLATPLALLAFLALAAPGALRGLLWRLGLGSGPAAPETVAAVLTAPLVLGFLSAALVAAVGRRLREDRLPLAGAAAVVAFLFLLDGARRVTGSCPTTPPELFSRRTPALEAVLAEGSRGRFHDDAADAPGVAVRRAAEADGLDPLRPVTGIVHGVRYAGENDVDRMNPAASLDSVRRLSGLRWGEEKVARLVTQGVAVARTPADGAVVAGTEELLRPGGDRIVRIVAPRPEVALLPEALAVGAGESLEAVAAEPSLAARRAAVEMPGPRGLRRFGEGSVSVVERHAARVRLRVTCAGPECLLAVARTFDPSWRAEVDGASVPSYVSDGFLTAVLLPAGSSDVVLRYANPLLALGAALTALSAAAALLLARRAR